jgi:hypothetical protein
MAGIGLLGLLVVAGAIQRVTAEEGPIPSDHIACYYNLYHCVYPNDSYWSGCDPNRGEGWRPTSVVQAFCREYHQEPW